MCVCVHVRCFCGGEAKAERIWIDCIRALLTCLWVTMCALLFVSACIFVPVCMEVCCDEGVRAK